MHDDDSTLLILQSRKAIMDAAIAALADPATPPLRRELLEICTSMGLGSHWYACVLDDAEGTEEMLRRMWRVFVGVRDEHGAPYRDARMLLTDLVIEFAKDLPGSRDGAAHDIARLVAERVRITYPTLADRFSDPERLLAVERALKASAKRPSWKAIVDCWSGIEAGERSPEAWRVEFARWRDRRGP